jgi:Helix-turn-helix domain (DUF4817)
MKLPLEQRIMLVQLYYENAKSLVGTLRAFRRITGIQDICSVNAIRNLISRFERTGSVADLPRSGRPKVSEDTAIEIRHTAETIAQDNRFGECSTVAISSATGIPQQTVWKVLRKMLKLRPYRIREVHELIPADYPRRLTFAENFLTRVEFEPNWLDTILFSDEAHFTLTGQVNYWNTRIWADHHPHTIFQTPLHDRKLTVWIGFTAEFIIGPYFFQEFDHRGELVTVTVNGDRYYDMLDEFVVPRLEELDVVDTITFQQDGAPPHVHHRVKDLLRAVFGDRIISRDFPHAWPARSPDLTPCDYWIWGYLKSIVYRNRPTTLVQLRESITQCVQAITPDQLRSAVYHMPKRLQAAIEAQGGHIEHLLR